MAGLMQPTTANGVIACLLEHGAAPGARKLLEIEDTAAQAAILSGIYTVYRSLTSREHSDFCTRIAPGSRCFCGHPLASHGPRRHLGTGNGEGVEKAKSGSDSAAAERRNGMVGRCAECECKLFKYVPHRPEEVGEFWLPRRKGFRVADWRAKCRCKCGSDMHAPTPPYRCRGCACGAFVSAFRCLVCERSWEEHSTVSESEAEREAARRPVYGAFVPLIDFPGLREQVFPSSRARAPLPAATAAELLQPFVRCLGRLGTHPCARKEGPHDPLSMTRVLSVRCVSCQ